MTNTKNIEFYCLGSSSSGNAYIMSFDNESILVECGLPFDELQKRAIRNGKQILDCVACLITHYHNDHANAISDCIKHGINVFTSASTFNHYNLKAEDKYILKDDQTTYITPNIIVKPFNVLHDCPESFGFIIKHIPTDTNVLFINDCKTALSDISGIPFDYVFIECNYSDQPLHIEWSNAKKANDRVLDKRYTRIHDYHMGCKACRELLNTLDLKDCKAIYLMHLSDKNAREQDMKIKVNAEHPTIPVFVCQKYGGIR